jgi:hypothetical protein
MLLTKWCVCLALVAVGMTLSLGGCAPSATSKAVLAGTWVLAEQYNPNPDLTDLRLTFDGGGELVSLCYEYLGATTTLDETALRSSSTIDGDDVTIVASFGDNKYNRFSFNGTLNADGTAIDGSTGFVVAETGYMGVYCPTGPAMLNKQ